MLSPCKQIGDYNMHDQYIQGLDDQLDSVKRYIEDYRCDIHTLSRLVFLMNMKMTYISKYPKRAENHYNRNTDAAFVKQVRKSFLKLDQAQFAKLLGVTRTTVSRWENGRLPLSDTKREFIQEQINKEIPF